MEPRRSCVDERPFVPTKSHASTWEVLFYDVHRHPHISVSLSLDTKIHQVSVLAASHDHQCHFSHVAITRTVTYNNKTKKNYEIESTTRLRNGSEGGRGEKERSECRMEVERNSQTVWKVHACAPEMQESSTDHQIWRCTCRYYYNIITALV